MGFESNKYKAFFSTKKPRNKASPARFSMIVISNLFFNWSDVHQLHKLV